MPMQGTDGPHRSFIGFGSTIAALGGLVHLTGEPGRIPVGTGTHYPDHVPNPGHSLVAILAALFEKHRTGRGQRIELSQLESTLNTIGPAFLASAVGEELGPSGNALPGVVPRGLYRTGDDHWVIIACPTDDIWDRLSALMIADGAERALQSLSLDERESRADEIDDAVSAWVSKRDRADVLNLLEDARVPNGQVNTSADVLDDPVLKGRRFWDTIEHPVIGEMPMFRLPFIREPGGRQPMTRPPLLGEHTWEVASEILGMDRERFEALTSAEILY
jgi:benzylsuccinate CoA-transferase BbsF subunit